MKCKILLYLNYLKKMYRSPARMILTLVGLVLSVVILVSGLVFSKTYMKSKTRLMDTYKEKKAIEVTGSYNYEIYRDILNENDAVGLEIIEGKEYKVGTVSYKNRNVNVFISDIRTDYVDLKFLSSDLYSPNRYQSMLMAGRTIEEKDTEEVSHVAVIYDTMATILYGKENPIGKTMSIPIYKWNEELGIMETDYYQELVVVGVIKDTRNLSEYLDDSNIEEEEELSVMMPVYIPLSLRLDRENNNMAMMRITAYAKEDYLGKVNQIGSVAGNYPEGGCQIRSYYSLKAEIMAEMRTVKEIIAILGVIMFAISGICIMNTMLFSVKERINEIGIRKAIGADTYHILCQFIMEGAVYGGIACAIGVVICLILDPLIFMILVNGALWSPGVSLCFSPDIVLVSLGASVLISGVASVIPAIYASKIKISDAIRSE